MNNTDPAHILRARLQCGEIFFVELTSTDGLIPKKGHTSQYKYIVIIGYKPQDDTACGVLLNSNNHENISTLHCANSYEIDHTQYPNLLSHTTYADCTLLVKISIQRLVGCYRGAVTNSDLRIILHGVWNSIFLTEEDLIEYNIKQIEY